ncbi:MAG: biopolymer transporter ExbD [Methanobrevibacter sp.]|jgi:biopolymer transport protein ExbD|nr:biopolymer transporter ExbD [Methanobrevibacter sp.]
MAIDVKKHRKKIDESKPQFNLVPFIDILFTILIFLVVTSSFATVADVNDNGGGKPNVTDSSGNSQYYMFPVAGLQKVIVNGQDMSSYIRDNAIGIHARVIDEGEIVIKAEEKTIIITTPPGMSVYEAVSTPTTT